MASSVERHFTPTYDLNGWNDEQSNNSIVLRPENFSIYDEEDSLDYDQIRPISAPSLANWYSTDFNENFDFNNEYDYTPAYTLPSNSVFNFQPRTVPRFYDSTTYRDHFVGYEQRKVQTPEFQDDHNTNLPAFNGETTNQATYLPHEYVVESRTRSSNSRYAQQLPPFEAQTTHRDAYTPKFVRYEMQTASTSGNRKPIRLPPIETETTNKHDFEWRRVERTQRASLPADNLRVGGFRSVISNARNRDPINATTRACPAEKVVGMLRKANQHNGHYYFPQNRSNRRSKSHHSSIIPPSKNPSTSMVALLLLLCFLALATADQTATRSDCPMVAVTECCQQVWSRNCPQPHCYKPIVQDCPERKSLVFSANASEIKDLRRAPQKAQEPKCGTAEFNYAPCTSNGIANNLFKSCCELYVPPECHAFCKYETDQKEAKELMIQMSNSKCHFKHLSSIFYCASQNRDNKQCCTDLGLSDPALMVGSRCLRFCDPSGTSIGRITKEDVTCLFNLGVINFCHRSGIREM